MVKVSNFKKPATKSRNWIPVIGQPFDRTPITRQIVFITEFDIVVGSLCAQPAGHVIGARSRWRPIPGEYSISTICNWIPVI